MPRSSTSGNGGATRAAPAARRETALVTGASSGIGRELAKLFARGGYDLVVVARNERSLATLAGELRHQYATTVTVIAADLSCAGTPDEIARRLDAERIAVDVLVNNAGAGLAGPFASTPLPDELALARLDVLAPLHLTKLFLPGMVSRGRGKVLNVASTAAFVPGPFMAGYYASKAYLLSLSLALASELRGTGVTVTALCPGPTRTGFAEAAKMQTSRLFRATNVMDAAAVARAGYRALMRGKPVAIPGLMNKLLVLGSRLGPRSLATAIARSLNEPAHTPPSGRSASAGD